MISLDSLKRYKPHAEFSISGDSNTKEPFMQVTASMVCTGNAVHEGFGGYVKFDDVLRLLIEVEISHGGSK